MGSSTLFTPVSTDGSLLLHELTMIEPVTQATNVAPLAPFAELETWYGIFAALAFEKTLRRVVKSRLTDLADGEHLENQRAEGKGEEKQAPEKAE